MKTAFIEGFVKAAVEQGLSDNTIARIFKRAMASPMGAQLFNQLPQGAAPKPGMPPQQKPSGQMQLAQLMRQDPQKLMILKQMLAQQQPQAQAM